MAFYNPTSIRHGGHRLGARFALLLVTVLAAAAADAGEVRVGYLVDARPLKGLAVAGTPLTFALFSDSACGTAVASQVVSVEATTLLEQVKLVKPKGAPRGPTPARIEHVMPVTSSGSFPTLYLQVTGTGITPVGEACQRQSAAFDGGSTTSEPPAVCAADAVRAAPDAPCVDRYETSVWNIPAANAGLLAKVQDGSVTLADLTGGGATQIGVPFSSSSSGCSPSYPSTFPANGQHTAPLYAVSIAGVTPSACLTPYQAAVACQLSGKRLLTSAEWLAVAAGTIDTDHDDGTTDPDGPGNTECNTDAGNPNVDDPVATGSRSACVSTAGMFDAIGNLYEWTADRTVDLLTGGPAVQAWARGGHWDAGTEASVTHALGFGTDFTSGAIGFRCGR